MEKPKSIKIFGQPYQIRYDYISDENYGLTIFDKNQILLVGDLPIAKLKRTLMHEITHAIIHESLLTNCDTFTVEQVCDLNGLHLLDVLLANPKVLAWITA